MIASILDTQAMTETRNKAYPLPCRDLYIYLIKGILRDNDEASLGNYFLGNWVEAESSFLFFSRPSSAEVTRMLNTRPNLELEDNYHFSYEEWQGGGLDRLRIGQFVIVPPWLDCDYEEGLIKIVLDPGVVFGNCLHPTTRDSLKALSLTARQTDLGRVLDLGTGTGILSIAAACLGAKQVLAVDLNPLCVKTAVKNVLLNHQEAIIEVVEGKAEDVADAPADLVVANIHHEVIKQFLENGVLGEKTRLIISGLMRSQYREIRTQLQKRSFDLIREWDHDMTWFTVLARPGTCP